MRIRYGHVIRVDIFNEEQTVALIDNKVAKDALRCLVLDLSTMKVLVGCRDIEDFTESFEVIEIIGDLLE